jgi:hypothetical protein
MQIYSYENVFTYNNKSYERLFNHPYQERYRVIFNDDDYDYIEDEELLNALEKEYCRIANTIRR